MSNKAPAAPAAGGKGKKEVTAIVKLQIPGGQANPAPPIGPVLGQHGVNIMEFCKQFNAKTQKNQGEVTPVILTVYKDRSFTFELKTPPVSYLLRKALGKEKGSGVPNKEKIGSLSKSKAMEIAKLKMQDLNCNDEQAAFRTVCGTARSMGIDIQ
ncbi:MAG TPA: 50S ribosomal protein L11 [Oligoflexia bacterium]|nr:50S ribosomal protein L11 [Oligoflexia bacterium]HMP26394.1 50S ribosomal protein L11 [Oligoflexia bacterium]